MPTGEARPGCIAVLNAGSSSIKFALYDVGDPDTALFRGKLEELSRSPRLKVVDAQGGTVTERSWPQGRLDHGTATHDILRTIGELAGDRPVLAVGHRVVHGGMKFAQPVRIDAGVMAALGELIPLAPLHQPHNLAPIQAIADAAPDMPQVACFDTAFHRDQAPVARAYALPRRLTEEGVLRYGFHGLSYEFVVSRLHEIAPELTGARVIIGHLGNGASLCAVQDGRSVATTMGFTALEGLMMGTRSGSLDPGVLLYLMDRHGMDARAIEDLLYRQSGLLGVSGIASDMRTLQASTDPTAAEAIALFVYRIVREVGSLAAALGGLDALVFTAGIGENDARLRAEVAAGCGWLGLRLDPARNERGEGRISADGSRLSAWVVPTNEERVIARQTVEVLRLGTVP